MIDPLELERMRAILRSEAAGQTSAAEKRELREILARHTEKALELPWYGLVDVADYTLAINGVDLESDAPVP